MDVGVSKVRGFLGELGVFKVWNGCGNLPEVMVSKALNYCGYPQDVVVSKSWTQVDSLVDSGNLGS